MCAELRPALNPSSPSPVRVPWRCGHPRAKRGHSEAAGQPRPPGSQGREPPQRAPLAALQHERRGVPRADRDADVPGQQRAVPGGGRVQQHEGGEPGGGAHLSLADDPPLHAGGAARVRRGALPPLVPGAVAPRRGGRRHEGRHQAADAAVDPRGAPPPLAPPAAAAAAAAAAPSPRRLAGSGSRRGALGRRR